MPIDELYERFLALDRDGTKRLDKDELRIMIQGRDIAPYEGQVLAILQCMDTGGDGTVDLNEFIHMLAESGPPVHEIPEQGRLSEALADLEKLSKN